MLVEETLFKKATMEMYPVGIKDNVYEGPE